MSHTNTIDSPHQHPTPPHQLSNTQRHQHRLFPFIHPPHAYLLAADAGDDPLKPSSSATSAPTSSKTSPIAHRSSWPSLMVEEGRSRCRWRMALSHVPPNMALWLDWQARCLAKKRRKTVSAQFPILANPSSSVLTS
ncbi:hypothetical protein Droror1_Dr00016521 [Drosera rotundifolia]